MYKTYKNPYYNPTDTQPKPGDNQNWEDIQRGFYRVHEAIEESGSGQGVTMIKVRVDEDGGAITAEITNIDEVKNKIGRFWLYPQMVELETVGLASAYKVYTPISSTFGSKWQFAARYLCADTSGAAIKFEELTISFIDENTWGVSFKTF